MVHLLFVFTIINLIIYLNLTQLSHDILIDNVFNNIFSAVSTIEISKEQRRGAIMVLNMFAKAKMEIVQKQIDLLLNIGLGQLGKVSTLINIHVTCYIIPDINIYSLFINCRQI